MRLLKFSQIVFIFYFFFKWGLQLGRGILTHPILWKLSPSILPHPRFPNFVQPPSLLPPTLTSTSYSVVLFLWLNGWSRHIWSILLNDIMNVNMSSLKTWMCVLCNKALGFIVCIEVSTPFKNTPPLFFAKHPPPPKSANCQSLPFLGISALYIGFSWTFP